MPRNISEIEHHVKKINADFCMDAWIKTTADTILRESIDSFINDKSVVGEKALPEQHAEFLAERVYIDSLSPADMSLGIESYLRHYVTDRFGADKEKIKQLDLICRDSTANNANESSAELAELLSVTTVTTPSIALEKLETIALLKKTRELMRYGDVVFLPNDADVIILGDTHGDLASTEQLIDKIKRTEHLERGGYVVLLGDYVNNGVKSWQNIREILKLQRAYPESIVLLNGNHEFKESYLTVLNQFFNTHWNRFTADDLPRDLHDRLPATGNHYGHLRLQLVRDFGFEEGERLYATYANWGMKLPLVCISGNVMISHSLGRQEGIEVSLFDLVHGKQRDDENMQRLGYESWNTSRPSLHSALVNNRLMTADLLSEFSDLLAVDHFVVGHCHYRSGDTLQLGKNKITTVASSDPYSPDAGHYMYEQMFVARPKKRLDENLTDGQGRAGYLHFASQQNGVRRSEFVDEWAESD